MGIAKNDEQTPSTPNKRLALKNNAAARESLCKIMRQYYNKEIDHTTFRNMVYGYSVLLGHDKHITETDLNKKIDLLESYIKGEGQTVIGGNDIDNPYSQELKRQLVNEQRINVELQNEILNIKRQLSETRAEIIAKDDQGGI